MLVATNLYTWTVPLWESENHMGQLVMDRGENRELGGDSGEQHYNPNLF